MTRWVVEHLGPDVPMHFTAFHPDWKMLDRPPTPPATLAPRPPRSRSRTASATRTRATCTTRRARRTRCPGCGALLIGRDGYEITAWTLDDGRPLPGVRHADAPACSSASPGTWGARRLPGPAGNVRR